MQQMLATVTFNGENSIQNVLDYGHLIMIAMFVGIANHPVKVGRNRFDFLG